MRVGIPSPPKNDGEHVVVAVTGWAAPWRSVLMTRAEGVLHAYWNVCRHLPVPLDGGLGQLPEGPSLVCLTHGARFRGLDGYCESGPCEGASLFTLACGESPDGTAWVEVEAPPI